MSKPLRIGIAGVGTVGGGTLAILLEHKAMLEERCGRAIEIAGVSARDRHRARSVKLDGLQWFDSPLEMAADPAIDVIVEAIGGAEGVARELVDATA